MGGMDGGVIPRSMGGAIGRAIRAMGWTMGGAVNGSTGLAIGGAIVVMVGTMSWIMGGAKGGTMGGAMGEAKGLRFALALLLLSRHFPASLCLQSPDTPPLRQTPTTQRQQAEVCETETFKAACPPGHVVLMLRGLYGRMRTGRCVDRDYGYIGCQVSS